MTRPSSREDGDAPDGCQGAVVTGLIGAAIGFALCLPMLALVPLERDNESRAWAQFAALMFGGGAEFVGGLLGLISGALVGPRVALKTFFTKGLLGGVFGVAIGYIGGTLISGLSGKWGLLTEWSGCSAIYAGLFGIVVGTIVGAWKRRRKN